MPLAPVAAPAVVSPVAPAPRAQRFAALVEARAPMAAAATSPPPRPGAPAALEAVERAQRRLDGILEAARSGRTFTAQDLLGLQAEAYRTVQTVDLATKLVEQGAQSVKQALNTQL